MKLAVISDLHMGRGDVTDRFGENDERFMLFLDFLEVGFDRIILLGDVYETVFAPFKISFAQELEIVRKLHKDVAARFTHEKYIQIHGNHDKILSELENVPDELQMNINGVKFLFLHGHLYSWLNRGGIFFGENGSRVGAWVKRNGKKKSYALLEKIFSTHGKSGRPEKGGYKRWAMKYARRRGVDVIVTAHTHQGGVSEHGGCVYLNSGSCIYGKFSYLSIDTETKTYNFHQEWKN